MTEAALHAIIPNLPVLRLLTSGCLVTRGELNALADYVVDANAMNTLPKGVIMPLLQQSRQELYNRLAALLNSQAPLVRFAQSIIADPGGSIIEAALEVRAVDALTKEQGVNHYNGLLARNACHFAPYAWYRWRVAHLTARSLASRAYAATNPEQKAQLTQLAWVSQCYADHFIEDCYAGGHQVSKTVIMQWFTAWAADIWLLYVPEWDSVKHVTTANQPGLMGSHLYERGYQGSSNDPQTAEERSSFQARMQATAVQAFGSTTQAEAYHQYLSFLDATVVQLSSNQVHNHFNENSLWVGSQTHPQAFQLWGDEKMLAGVESVGIASDTVHLSQQVIQQLLDSGQSKISPQDVLDCLPSKAGTQASLKPLKDWHDNDLRNLCISTWNSWSNRFKDVTTILGPQMGLLSVDQRTTGFATKWTTPLDGSGYDVVNLLHSNGRLFAGANGHLYELNPQDGKVLHQNGMSGYGNNPLTLATDDHTLFAGINGYVVGVDLGDFSIKWYTGLSGAGWNPVELCYEPGRLFAGSRGNVYEIDLQGRGILHHNGMSGYGNNPITLASGSLLYAGINGWVVGLDKSDLSIKWNTGMSGAGWNNVNVLAAQGLLFAGSDGQVYQLDATSGALLHQNGLPGLRYFDVNLALASKLYVGSNGAAVGLDRQDVSQPTWQNNLSALARTPVAVLADDVRLFAGANGYAYQLDPQTGTTMYNNGLGGTGYHEVRLASDGATLYAGTNGYVVGISLDPK